LAGNAVDFKRLIKMYETMAAEMDVHSEYENLDRADEFLDSLESDPSKAELMTVC
jgi:hypothetical protein